MVNHFLESVLCLCQKCTFLSKEYLIDRLGWPEEEKEIEDSSFGSEPDDVNSSLASFNIMPKKMAKNIGASVHLCFTPFAVRKG